MPKTNVEKGGPAPSIPYSIRLPRALVARLEDGDYIKSRFIRKAIEERLNRLEGRARGERG